MKTGCQWRLMPEYNGAWQTVYYYFRTLRERGFFSKIKRKLLENKRIRSKKRKSPSLAVIDSKSVRSGVSKSEKGIDGNKKIKGIKRHISVDSAGNPHEIIITRANIHDSKVSAALIFQDISTNYEQFLHTAQIMAEFAFMMLLSKHI